MVYLVSAYTCLLKCPLNSARNNFDETFIPDPTLFPAVIEFLFLTAEVIDKIYGDRMATEEFGNPVTVSYQKRRRAVSELKFLRACGAGFSLVAGRHQLTFAGPPGNRVERR